MVEWELSRLVSMWNKKLRHDSAAAGAGEVSCAAVYGNGITTTLAPLTQGNHPGQAGVVNWRDLSVFNLEAAQQRVRRGRPGEEKRFDEENVHHP
jgi:hypothetical protein